MRYAPPEELSALQKGEHSVAADAAADVWALGVIAFELLTRHRVFGSSVARDTMKAQLLGREALPWEREAGAQGQRCVPDAVTSCRLLLCHNGST